VSKHYQKGSGEQNCCALNILNGKYLDEEEMSYILDGEDVGKECTGVQLRTVFGGDGLRRLFVIAEGYDKKKCGRVKRAWLKQFTPKERKLVSRWYARIYAWYLRTGIPVKGVVMAARTYNTLCKAADFFATT
jgi:hypothetical protein